MRKILYIFLIFLIVGFIFSFFNSQISVFAKGCDWETPTCGGWSGCRETTTQSKCFIDCFFGYEYPKCDCQLKTEGKISLCWCECDNECAKQWCQGHGYATGKCNTDTGGAQCCETTESSCGDDIDNDCNNKTDCEDAQCNGKICGDNKVCKAGKCVQKGVSKVCSANCENIVLDCLCGGGEKPASRGQYCCGSLSKVYTIKANCESECESNGGNGGNGGGDGGGGGGGSGGSGPSIVSGGGSVDIQNPLEHDTFDALVQAIVNFIFKIAMVIAPLMIIVAGFFYLTAMGDPEKIKTAHKVIMYTLIGLVICLMATGIIKLINTVLGV